MCSRSSKVRTQWKMKVLASSLLVISSGKDVILTADTVQVQRSVCSLSGLLDVHLHELSSEHLSVFFVITVIILSFFLSAWQCHIQSQWVVPEIHKPAETRKSDPSKKQLQVLGFFI